MRRHIWFLLSAGLVIAFLIVITATKADATAVGWSPEIRLTYNESEAGGPAIAVHEETIHVAWRDDRDGNDEVYYKRSTTGGTDWGPDIRLTNALGDARFIDMVVRGEEIHMVWEDNRDGNREIYYKRSMDNGASWIDDVRLTDDPADSSEASVAVNGSTVHVVWGNNKDGNFDVFYRRSTDSGENWGEVVELTSGPKVAAGGIIAVSGNDVHVVWADNRNADDNFEIYYRRSTDNGGTWESDVRLTDAKNHSVFNRLAVNGSNIHVTWTDMRDGVGQVYYKRSINNGESWGDDIKLTEGGLFNGQQGMAVDGDTIHVIYNSDKSGMVEVYYRYSQDNGDTWGGELMLTSDDGYYSASDTITARNDTIHFLWTDEMDGNKEIYYRRNPNLSPMAESLETPSEHVYIGDSIIICAEGSDDIDLEIQLSPTFECRAPSDDFWRTDILSSPSFGDPSCLWQSRFTPANDSETGLYGIRVRFKDLNGQYSEWLEMKDAVDVREHPAAILTVSGTTFKTGEVITFHGDDSIGKDLTYNFDFGDGTNTNWTVTDSVNHSYSGTGSYSTKLKVMDDYYEETPWIIVDITVVGPPTSNLTANLTQLMEGGIVVFDASNSEGEGLLYYFDFGDGEVMEWTTHSAMEHMYSDEGTFTAKVKVKDTYDNEGPWSSITISVEGDIAKSKEDDTNNGYGLEIGLVIIIFVLASVIVYQNKKWLKK